MCGIFVTLPSKGKRGGGFPSPHLLVFECGSTPFTCLSSIQNTDIIPKMMMMIIIITIIKSKAKKLNYKLVG